MVAMAHKRMFNRDIVESDALLDMSKGAQSLYVHLCMNADDDGLLGNARRIIRSADSTPEEYKELLEQRFVIEFPNGIVVIKHWWINNDIKKDRYHPTKYTEEIGLLTKKGNGSYTENIQKWIQLGYKVDTQYRIGIATDIDIGNTTGPASKEARVGKRGGMRGMDEIIKQRK